MIAVRGKLTGVGYLEFESPKDERMTGTFVELSLDDGRVILIQGLTREESGALAHYFDEYVQFSVEKA